MLLILLRFAETKMKVAFSKCSSVFSWCAQC